MSDADLYTVEEMQANLKAINVKLNKGISQSDLDTGQSQHEFRLNVRQLEKQRAYWSQLLKIKTGKDGGIVQVNVHG